MRYDFRRKEFIETDITPNKLAVAGSDRDITWNELKLEVEKLSGQFNSLNIPKGHPVIIYGHKEANYMVAILACIHASIPYIPTDIIYPEERIQKIKTTTGSQVLLNVSDNMLTLDFPICFNAQLSCVKKETPDFTDRVYGEPEKDPLQYIIFTSGSTGEPKGVQITRDAAIAFTDWLRNDYGFTGNDVFINQAPFTFDLSMYDVLSNFVMGGTIVLNSAELFKNQDAYLKRLNDYKGSVWFSTPSFGFMFLRHPGFNQQNLPHLRILLFIGEELPNRTPKILKGLFPDATIYNAYGPTEATVATTLIEITHDIIDRCPSLPIGYAMPGSTLSIEKVDPNDKEGELIIAGPHVSIGYFKSPELNSQKYFIQQGERAFKTGDLAYFEGDVLFFIGRNDNQVKMNGFRIELGEITNVIAGNPAVIEAITLPLKRNSEVKKLVSFVQLNTASNAEQVKSELLHTMEKKLPNYMIPGDIVVVNDFPYNQNHKIDGKKLVTDYIASI